MKQNKNKELMESALKDHITTSPATNDPAKIRRLYELAWKEFTGGVEIVFLIADMSYLVLLLMGNGTKALLPFLCMSSVMVIYLYRLRKYREVKLNIKLSLILITVINTWALYLIYKADFWFKPVVIRTEIWMLLTIVSFYFWYKIRNFSLTLIMNTGLLLLLFTFSLYDPVWTLFLVIFIVPCFVLFPSYSMFHFKESKNLYEFTRTMLKICLLYPPEKFPTELYPDPREYKIKIRSGLRPEPILIPLFAGQLLFFAFDTSRMALTLPPYRLYFIILYWSVILIFLNEIRLYNMNRYRKTLEKLVS